MYTMRFLDHPNPPSDRVNPMQSLRAYATEPSNKRDLLTNQYSCHVPSLGLPGTFVTPRGTDILVGQQQDVRITDVQAGLKSLFLLELCKSS